MGLIKPTSDELENIAGVKPKKFKPRYNLEDLFSAKPVEIPRPDTHYAVVQLARIPEKDNMGIYITDHEVDMLRYGQFIVKILALGRDSFTLARWKDYKPDELPKVGEFVMIGRHDGYPVAAYDEKGEVVHLKLISADGIIARANSPLHFKFTT